MSKRAFAFAILLASTSSWAAPPTVAPAPPAPKAAAPAAAGTKAAPAAPGAKPAGPSDPALAALERLALSIQRVTLDNGLRVVLNVDQSSPTVAVSVTYDVGSRNEGPGQSGFAHLFEHMMFQGSKNVLKGEHFALISQRGGSLNGTTSADRTNYYESLPSSELELALFLEADRMRWLAVTAENFENQRAVVKEEYRMRVDQQPYGRSSLRLGEITFADYPPYAHSTIGSMQDLDAAKLEWVADFYQTYYAPNNAVLTIAGDFDVDRALELVQKHFGPAERKPVPAFVEPAPTKPTTPAARREAIDDKNAATPAVFWAFRIPKVHTPEHYALELAAMVLADGESSRLHQRLVRDRALLQSVGAWTDDRRGPDAFGMRGILTEKAKVSEIEQAFEAELLKLAKTPPTADEMSRAKSRLKHHFLFALQSNGTRSTRLGEYEVYYGDARLLTRELAGYLAVKPADVQQAVKQYLKPELRFTIETKTVPRPAAGGAS